MTLPLELCGREKVGDSEAAICSFLFTPRLCLFSLFMFSRVIEAKKETCFLHGGGQVTAGSEAAPLITSQGKGSLS